MYPGQHNLYPDSISKEKNYSNAAMLEKSDTDWTKRLEILFNNTNDQGDYFQVYSEPSNTTVSTICLNSSRGRDTDSNWSDTDDTRRDDIVIQLSESAFYNTKVNPFPHLNFPPTNKTSERNLARIVRDDQNFDKLIMTNRVNSDLKTFAFGNNGRMSPAVNEDKAMKSETNDLKCDQNKEGQIKEESNDNRLAPSISDFKSDHKIANSTPAAVVTDELRDIENISFVNDVPNEVKVDQNYESLPYPENAAEGTNILDLAPSAHHVTNDLQVDVNLTNLSDREDGRGVLSPLQVDTNEGLALSADVKEKIKSDVENENFTTTHDVDPCRENYTPTDSSRTLPETTSTMESRKSNKIGPMERGSSEPKPVVSSSFNESYTNEQRKKRYRTKNKCTEHRVGVCRKNVNQLTTSSCCTNITSTTTVHVTTNDDKIFEALVDMPKFINSSVIDSASNYVDERIRKHKNLRTRFIDVDQEGPASSSSSCAPSWRNERMSLLYDDYISPREAYKQLDTLLRDGTKENLMAVMYDDYNNIRFDDEIASSEEEFLSDVDDLDLTKSNWTPPESELRRQVAIVLRKLHPLENNYSNIIDDMLFKYLNYIRTKKRMAKINRIVDCVNKPISQQEKTELLIQREIDDKKLNHQFYYSPMEPRDFTELGERRREAIIKKYTRCHNDRVFCHNYFERLIDDRPVSKFGRRIAKLKNEMGLIFA